MAKTPEAKTEERQVVTISPPNFQLLKLKLVGTAPLMQARFAKKAELMAHMAAEKTGSKTRVRKARDYDKDCQECIHRSHEGWAGVPCSAIRNASIDACRMAGYKMTHAKMSIFVEPDGFDQDDNQPLVELHAGKYEQSSMQVRNANGSVDIRVRPLWTKWELRPVIRFDGDQFTVADVINLIARAGMQVGIGEGRPFGRDGNGLGFGLFKVETD